jgi:hypothetical protein
MFPTIPIEEHAIFYANGCALYRAAIPQKFFHEDTEYNIEDFSYFYDEKDKIHFRINLDDPDPGVLGVVTADCPQLNLLYKKMVGNLYLRFYEYERFNFRIFFVPNEMFQGDVVPLE